MPTSLTPLLHIFDFDHNLQFILKPNFSPSNLPCDHILTRRDGIRISTKGPQNKPKIFHKNYSNKHLICIGQISTTKKPKVIGFELFTFF